MNQNEFLGPSNWLPDQPELIGLTPPPERMKPVRWVLPLILFLLTGLSTIVAGYLLEVEFSSGSTGEAWTRILGLPSNPADLLYGLPFSVTIMTILLAHEMGHYLACRYHGIDATLPYFLPAPPVLLPFGTLGAVIRIRAMFQNRRQLFDVGVAGPLAGFLFILPALVVGVSLSEEFGSLDSLDTILVFGEPLLFKLAVFSFFEGDSTFMKLHPVGFAAWFGMLATSLNLLPVGQLDGGHIVFSLLGSRGHRVCSYVTFFGLIAVSLLSWPMLGYLFFGLILLLLRLRHPSPIDGLTGVGGWRRAVAIVALLIFALTFIPVPVELVEQFGSL